MSGDAETIYNAALALPAAERGELAERLRQSIEGEADAPTPAEAAEIDGRLEDVRSGRVQAIQGDDAYAAVLQRLRERNRP